MIVLNKTKIFTKNGKEYIIITGAEFKRIGRSKDELFKVNVGYKTMTLKVSELVLSQTSIKIPTESNHRGQDYYYFEWCPDPGLTEEEEYKKYLI